MQIIHTVSDLRAALKNQSSIGFVPTMGNLHAGHIQLVEIAKQHANTCVVVSIFVNPLHCPTEDEELPTHYDYTSQIAGCDIVFAPSVGEMYADFDGKTSKLKHDYLLLPLPIANVLCGATRLSHFAGVTRL